jgi:hypothetical protein
MLTRREQHLSLAARPRVCTTVEAVVGNGSGALMRVHSPAVPLR